MSLNQDVDMKDMVVKVDQNSEVDLQRLFDSVLKPEAMRPLHLPLRMRNLPESFFVPPSTGSKSPSISHSRENSADSAFGTLPSGPNSVAGSSPGSSSATGAANNSGSGVNGATAPNGLTVAHPRAHSSPASLQQTYASAQQANQHAPQPHSRHIHHQKQRSYDVVSTVDDLGPLPHGWEQARTPEGQIYFLK